MLRLHFTHVHLRTRTHSRFLPGDRVKALARDVEDARADARLVRQRASDEQETFKVTRSTLEKESAALRLELSNERHAHAELREERVKLLAKADKLQEDNARMTSELDVAKRQVSECVNACAMLDRVSDS